MEGYPGQWFTFTGLGFTPNGLIHEGFTDPNQVYHYNASFFADSAGGFVRDIASDWDSYTAFDFTENYSTSVQFTISASPSPGEPAIAVSPGRALIGEWFVFTGSHFTPNGLVEGWLVDPDQTPYRLKYFWADPSGGFIRKHSWAGTWPAGTYTYLVFDFTRSFWASVEFEMTDSLLYEVYLPIIVKHY